MNWSVTTVPNVSGSPILVPAFRDLNNGIAWAQDTLLKTSDGGVTWTPLSYPSWLGVGLIHYVRGTTGMYVMAGSINGIDSYVYTLDEGSTWRGAGPRHPTDAYYSFAFPSRNHGWGTNFIALDKWTIQPGAIIGNWPTPISFGSVEAGSVSDTMSVSVTNFGASPMVVSSIVPQGVSFRILNTPSLPVSLSTLETVDLRLLFPPQQGGLVTDSLVVVSNAANGTSSAVILTGNGFAVERAQAGTLYAMSGTLAGGRLFTVNTNTGAATPVGPSGFTQIVSARVHPTTNEILSLVPSGVNYALARTNSLGGDAHTLSTIALNLLKGMAFRGDTLYVGRIIGQLYRVNVATGDATLVSTSAGINFSGLAFNPVTGQLWASVRAPNANPDRIYKISLPDGTPTLVGATGVGPVNDIIFDGRGRLFGIAGTGTTVNSFIRIDTTTGAGTVIGSMGFASLQALAARPDSFLTAVSEPTTNSAPHVFSLEQNYPNPFNPTTEIRFSVESAGMAKLEVYNLLGQRVVTLFDKEAKPGMYYGVTFDASNLASGTYIYRLQSGKRGDLKKLLLLK